MIFRIIAIALSFALAFSILCITIGGAYFDDRSELQFKRPVAMIVALCIIFIIALSI